MEQQSVFSDHGDHYSVRAAFAADPDAVAAARKYTVEKLRDWGAGEQSAAAALIVSELASNAIKHACSEFELSLRWDDERLRITVSDASAVRPVPRKPEPGATSGYGLNIVNALASDWGCTWGNQGKEIWVQLPGLSEHLTASKRRRSPR
jgi:anti-sigma regulatory factor (Ser/Thr protein kinase)